TLDEVDPAGSPLAMLEVNTRNAQNQSDARSGTRVARSMKCRFPDLWKTRFVPRGSADRLLTQLIDIT
ncbi:MAG: hypothetical protein WB853_10885, partial [Desulfobacterales bacterium]